MDAKRDWGFAGDYVKGMKKMIDHHTPGDWVLATGETHTVKEFVTLAFESIGYDWNDYVEISKKYFRPNEVDHLLGDPSRSKKELGWKPETDFKSLVKMMVEHDIELAEQEKVLIKMA